MATRRALLLALSISLALAIPAGPAAARGSRAYTPVPRGFVGINIGGSWLADGVTAGQQFDLMASSGVQSVRVLFNWSLAQPDKSWADVPAAERGNFVDIGRVPTDFRSTDQIVALAASHHIAVMPVVAFAPTWDAAAHPSGTYGIPASNRPYARFITALIARYGPRGSFWRTHPPKVPIRMWQIWNEPNLAIFWPRQPFARSYVSLLRAVHAAVKHADRGAKVVLAGLPNYSWTALRGIYAVPGARRQFDVVAIHPYTRRPRGVLTILNRIRRVMDGSGDRRKGMLADEVSWPSSLGQPGAGFFGLPPTEKRQARNLSALLPLLAAERRRLGLLGFDWYTWTDAEQPGGALFDFAGLLRFSSGRYVPKPALFAFRRVARVLESCGRRAGASTACGRR